MLLPKFVAGALSVLVRSLFAVLVTLLGSAAWAAPGQIITIAGTGDDFFGGFAGDGGFANLALLDRPYDVAIAANGDLYFTDSSNFRIRKIDAETGIVVTVAGTGDYGFAGDGNPASQATFAYPQCLVFDAAGNLYVADSGNHRIRRIDAVTGIITTVAGSGTPGGFSGDGGPATAARLWSPKGIAFNAFGDLFIADSYNHRIRKVDAATGIISTVAGDGAVGYGGDGGPAVDAALHYPEDVAVGPGGDLYLADLANHRVRKVDAATGIITTVAGNGLSGDSGDGGPATGAGLEFPASLALDGAGNLLVATVFRTVRRVDAFSGIISTVAGNGSSGFGGDGGAAVDAQLDGPRGLALDAAGSLLIADYNNNRVRKVFGVGAGAATGALHGLGDKCADILQADPADGTPVALFTCHGGANQQWTFEPVGSSFRLVGLGGKCLLPGGVGPSGFNETVIGSCAGSASLWNRNPGFPDDFTLIHADSGQCLDVLMSNTADGTPIIVFPCTGNPNQRWRFEGDAEPPAGGLCQLGQDRLCLQGGRFRAEVTWRDFQDRAGVGQIVPFGTDDSGTFWFFSPDNWELQVKVLDNCGGNTDRFWVFAAASTNVEYTLTVTDTETGAMREYFNPLGTRAPAIADTQAFATCP